MSQDMKRVKITVEEFHDFTEQDVILNVSVYKVVLVKNTTEISVRGGLLSKEELDGFIARGADVTVKNPS